MKQLNYTISRIPIFLFLITVVFNVLFSVLDLSDDDYMPIYFWAVELIGNSLVLNIFILLICYRNKLCWYNKVSAFGLISLNVVNFLFITFPIGYELYYTITINIVMIPVAVLALILFIKGV